VVAVSGAERQRGGTRLTFVCGGRALKAWRTYRDAVAGSVRVVSVLPGELPAAVERLQAAARDHQKQVRDLKERLAAYEAARLMAEAASVAGVRVGIEIVEGADAAELKTRALAAVASARGAVVLLSPGPPVSIVVARSAGVALDAHALLRQLLARFGGRGGGKPDLAQGGGLTAPPAEIAAAVRALIDAALPSGAAPD
jgi:alanyl-tRNA synthetase